VAIEPQASTYLVMFFDAPFPALKIDALFLNCAYSARCQGMFPMEVVLPPEWFGFWAYSLDTFVFGLKFRYISICGPGDGYLP